MLKKFLISCYSFSFVCSRNWSRAHKINALMPGKNHHPFIVVLLFVLEAVVVGPRHIKISALILNLFFLILLICFTIKFGSCRKWSEAHKMKVVMLNHQANNFNFSSRMVMLQLFVLFRGGNGLHKSVAGDRERGQPVCVSLNEGRTRIYSGGVSLVFP